MNHPVNPSPLALALDIATTLLLGLLVWAVLVAVML